MQLPVSHNFIEYYNRSEKNSTKNRQMHPSILSHRIQKILSNTRCSVFVQILVGHIMSTHMGTNTLLISAVKQSHILV